MVALKNRAKHNLTSLLSDARFIYDLTISEYKRFFTSPSFPSKFNNEFNSIEARSVTQQAFNIQIRLKFSYSSDLLLPVMYMYLFTYPLTEHFNSTHINTYSPLELNRQHLYLFIDTLDIKIDLELSNGLKFVQLHHVNLYAKLAFGL